MTCIIGVEHEGVVYMGADSIALNGWAKDVIAQDKLFKRYGMLFGCAGNPRMAQILRYQVRFSPQSKAQTDEEYLVCEVIEKARLAFKEYGYTETENGREMGANFLLGYNGKLYSVENSFQLCRSARKMYAMGAGDDFALGALWTVLEPYARWDGEIIQRAIERALVAAAELSAAVSAPFVIEKLSANEVNAEREAHVDNMLGINKAAFLRP